ncbi:kinase D-interacting substrate of 220 kDa-like isoform X2 [Liolophura sinensis]|uniref:kinase D-interacting substrate of 220 kDa-like isoform X2 n=1 Tax=Liolophura sinensis TaxID=3198878 RepID=UPI00315940B3
MTAISFRGQLLWENIKRGDLAAVVNLLESGGINLEEKDENGQTFLMLACERGELSIVRELLENDVDVNAVDNESWSALLCAAREGHLEIVIELLERDAVLEHRDMCNWTALMWACYKGKVTVVQELLDRGANPNVKADHNMTCLSWAAGRGYTEIVSMLLQKGAKINSPDKYGTTPLIWASRKGYLEIVRMLLQEGTNVDVAGMNSWTALLAATSGGYAEVVGEILEKNANANALDKDGFTALTIAAKEGYTEIAQDLLSHGAYVNLKDRDGDSILIHAVKGGHIEVVQSLLNKYADVDIQGSEGKSALYWAVEKGHNDIVRILLNNDADTELATKDNDTALLRAVKSRNEECVRLLLEKNAKVSTVDKRGDTPLHISLRARSKRITELLLRNPKNSRLLYRHNKSGETPYSIDAYYQKGILTQIFGHRNLNANDGENLLGYEIYSSALADILSEPSLNTPITVGLYAKWGSGKSFLLGKLQDEMKSFTQQYVQGQFEFTKVIFFVFFLLNSVVGLALGLSTLWSVGLGVGLGLFIPEYGFLAFIYVASQRYDIEFAVRISCVLRRKMDTLTLLLKLLFCAPHKQNKIDVPRVRFLFSDYTRITSVGGEKALAVMIGTLCDAVEQELGPLVARLYRIFKPQPNASSTGGFKSICCIPYFFLVICVGLCLVTGVVLLVRFNINNGSVNPVLITLACIVGLAIMGNLYTWAQAIASLYISQKTRVLAAADHLDTLKVDGFMQRLKQEVDLMSEMVTNMDMFTGNETRLVVVVDGLDSCEQDRILQFLDTVKTLFSDADSAFITILAVDPHIIIRGIEQNLRTAYHDANIHGYDYLRNIVHLPFYLQSQGVRVQQEDYMVRASNSASTETGFAHQESVMSSLSLAEHKHKKPVNGRKKNNRLNSSTWHTSSFDLSKTLIKNDYFSDINPRSMRRLMNIVAVTGRLLRAYNIEFSWYRLAAWINLIEQWPYRVSWIILYWEEQEGMEDNSTLRNIYDKIVDKIPNSKEVEPLLEIDRNVRKLETFLTSHSTTSATLSVGDLKKFLPCTINLDPYLRKLIRDLQQNVDVNRADYSFMGFPGTGPSRAQGGSKQTEGAPGYGRLGSLNRSNFSPRDTPTRGPVYGGRGPAMLHQGMGYGAQHMMPSAMTHPYYMNMVPPHHHHHPVPSPQTTPPPQAVLQQLHSNIGTEKLSHLSPHGVCNLLSRLERIDRQHLAEYQSRVLANNITGIVLLTCEMDELKQVMQMTFGDWQLLRLVILSLREREAQGSQETDGSSGSQRDAYLASSFDTLDGEDYKLSTFTNSQHDMGGGCPLEAPLPRYADSGSIQLAVVPSLSEPATQALPITKETVVESRSAPHVTLSSTNILQKPKPKIRRNNSIVEQVKYESELLRGVYAGFEEENESEEEDEEDSAKESEKGSLVQPHSSAKPRLEKTPSVRFFVENESAAAVAPADQNSFSDSSSQIEMAALPSEGTGTERAEEDRTASDSEPLLKLSSSEDLTSSSKSSHKKDAKSKFGLVFMKEKLMGEGKRPFDLSSEEEDVYGSMGAVPTRSPPQLDTPSVDSPGQGPLQMQHTSPGVENRLSCTSFDQGAAADTVVWQPRTSPVETSRKSTSSTSEEKKTVV